MNKHDDYETNYVALYVAYIACYAFNVSSLFQFALIRMKKL
jgi:hypothetical protein